MKAKKIIAFALAFATLLTILTACSNKTAEPADTQTSSNAQIEQTPASSEQTAAAEVSEEEKYGGTLKIALSSAVSAQSIDPIGSNGTGPDQIIQNYGEGLVRQTSNGEYVPAFATDWEVSEDGMQWVFHLRQGVHFQKGEFQDGREATADDVVYSLERSRTQHWNNPLFMVDSIEKLDDYTVKVVLNRPYAAFLERCTSSNTIIVPKEDVEGWGDDFCLHPTSIGPFQVVEHVADQYTKMVRNETYWGVRPYLDALEYYCITDSAQALNALLTGEIDVVLSLSVDAIKQVKLSDAVKLYQEPENRIAYVGLNSRYEQLSNPQVREALIRAVDASALATAYQEDMAIASRLPLPVLNWGYDETLLENIPEFDPETAKQLLSDAGYADGFKLKCTLAKGNDELMRAATILQSYWSQIGVELEIQPVSASELTEMYTSGSVQVWLTTQGGTSDPATFVGYFTSEAKLNTNQNSWGYSKPETEELNLKALSMSDREARQEIYREITADFLNEDLGIFFATTKLNMAANQRVQGLVLENKSVLTVCGAPDTGVNIWVKD